MIKALFIFPPLWVTNSISAGIPQIMGFLEKNGYTNIEALDLNIKFFQYFYKKEKLEKIWENIIEERTKLSKLIKADDGSNQFQLKSNKRKFTILHKYISEKDTQKNVNNAINRIEDIVKKYKSNNFHINYSEFKKNKKILMTAYELVKLQLLEHASTSPDYYLKFINNTENNPYKEFFAKFTDEIIKQNYDYIGFSINSDEQAIAALILTKMLREKGIKSHICYGGSNAHYLKSVVLKNKEYFDNYIDALMLGAGEYPTMELFEYLEGKRKISDVASIIYRNEKGEIKENEIKQILENKFVISSYKGYDFREYTLPESVIPIRTSFGCYWGKCTFCNYNILTKYEQRNVDSVIDEIKYYIKNYKINNFYFVDASLSPKFLREFSTKIKQEKLEIYYFTNLRFEKDFTKEFLTQLYETGLRCCGWGLESGSPRILKLMKKGTEIENIKKILKTAHEIGLYNHLYYIIWFPTETKADFDMTMDFMKENIDYIDSIAHHNFHLEKDTYIYSHPKEFNIDPETLKKEGYKRENISIDDMKYCYKRIKEIYDKIAKKNLSCNFEGFVIQSKMRK